MVYLEAYIRPHEQMPATTGEILARFGREFERQAHGEARENLRRTPAPRKNDIPAPHVRVRYVKRSLFEYSNR